MIEMYGLATLSGVVQAIATVGLVFMEALTLYAGYGALMRITVPTVRARLGGG